MAAPKAQDMSVRDEDTLAQDQSLDRLQASMKKTLGFDGGPTGLVHMDTSELHQFMGELGEKMAQHDRLVVSPPWLEHLQAKLGALDFFGDGTAPAPERVCCAARSGRDRRYVGAECRQQRERWRDRFVAPRERHKHAASRVREEGAAVSAGDKRRQRVVVTGVYRARAAAPQHEVAVRAL